MYTVVPTSEPRGFDPAIVHPSSLTTLVQTHENLVGTDWIKGPTGTNNVGFDFSPFPLTFKTGTVAESWEIPDETTIIYHIRKGVHFALDPNSAASRLVNGRELDANDVVYSISRNFFEEIPKSFHRSRWLPEEWPLSVTAPDKWTVVVKTNQGFLDSVLLSTADWTALIPHETVEKYGNLNDWRNSVGTGAFMLTDYVPGSSATFVRNPNYWQMDPFHSQNQLPYLDGVKYLNIKDMSTILAGLRTGKIDSLYQKLMIPQDDVESLKKTNPEMKFRQVLQNPSALHFIMNNPALPWSDIMVRRALQIAIDREAIARDYYQGDAMIHAGPIAPHAEYMPMYTSLEELPGDVQELFTYNPEKAKQMLAEAGYPNGFKMKVTTSDQYDIDLLAVVKFYWEQIGVDVEIDIKERAVFTSMTQGRTVMEAGWTTSDADGPYAFHMWTPEDPSSYGQIVDQHNYEVREEMMKNYMRNEEAIWPLMKDFYVYALE